MADWMPIETAPKDGTRILVVNKDEGADSIEITEWYSLGHDVYRERPDGLYERHHETYAEGWNGNGHRATHWQPLPPPPTEDR
jgi:hypothetical protein